MLHLRNTPDSDSQVPPAEIIYGRQLRDSFSFLNNLDKFCNTNVRPMWRTAWKLKEEALRTRFVKNSEMLNQRAGKSMLAVGVYYRTRVALTRVNGTEAEW